MSDWNPQLYQAIQQQTADPLLQQALLVGSYGESTWGQSPNIFGFTSSAYTGDASLDTSGQVQAILPSYEAAENQLPKGLSGLEAAEWIALGAEKPAFSTPDTISAYPTSVSGGTEYQLGYSYTPGISIPAGGISEQTVIQQTDQYTQYGANSSATPTLPGVWNQIVAAQKQAGVNPNATTITASSTGTVSGGSGNSGLSATSGNRETNPQAVAYAKSMLTTEASAQPGFGNQAATAIAQTTNPFVTTTKPNDPSKSASGWLTDAIGLLTFGSLAQTGGPVTLVRNTLDTDANAAATIAGTTESNIWSIVTSGLVRIGIGVVGLMFVAAGLYLLVTHFGGGATPVPIPV